MTMGDRDYRALVQNSIDSIGRELEARVDASDGKTIHLHEASGCLRRSYYDRKDPMPVERRGFSDLLSGLLGKLGYGAEPAEYDVGGGIRVRGKADMVVDDAVVLYRSAAEQPDNPRAGDLMYLNACLWMLGKPDGIIIYITGDRREASFSLTRNAKMFEETVRRVKVLADLLEEGRTPIIEPSSDCSGCQYYQRCFIREKIGRSVSIAELVGLKKS